MCLGRDDLDGVPVHIKWCHFGVGMRAPYEYEWIIDRRITPEDDAVYCAQVEHELWPWTLEKLTGFFIQRQYEVVWMRRAR
jgi:hypothetical protein